MFFLKKWYIAIRDYDIEVESADFWYKESVYLAAKLDVIESQLYERQMFLKACQEFNRINWNRKWQKNPTPDIQAFVKSGINAKEVIERVLTRV